jgi:DNA-binding CsgD family transcriptional regulator/tetratricopeptide (TPR) repeat protein
MTRTHPATADFNNGEFQRAFLAADYAECRRLLESRKGGDRETLLAAKVAWREQRYLDMIGALSSFKPANEHDALERDVLLGAALGSTKEYETARMRLDRVLEDAKSNKELKMDAVFYKSLVAWMQFEHRESETLASELLKGDPNDHARGHILLSWIAIRRHDVQTQVIELTAALDVLDKAKEPDEHYRAKALMTLALLCRELPLPEQTLRVRQTYDKMEWTTGTVLPHFQTTRFLGWVEALQGNEVGAFGLFRTAMSLAPSDAWRVLCLTDRAYLARNTGEQSFATDLLHDAHGLAKKVAWHDTADEERSALIVLAELFADVDPAVSQQYLAQFRSLTASVLPGLSYGTDPRVRAFANYSSGMALMRFGERAEAVRLLSEAWEIFHAFGYGWREALCAFALHEATSEIDWLNKARHAIAPWPRSWIARDIATAGQKRERSAPSTAQRRVLELLLEGKSNAAIAKALGRSPYTVRNHISQLFKNFRVTNRTQLASLFSGPDSAGRGEAKRRNLG